MPLCEPMKQSEHEKIHHITMTGIKEELGKPTEGTKNIRKDQNRLDNVVYLNSASAILLDHGKGNQSLQKVIQVKAGISLWTSPWLSPSSNSVVDVSETVSQKWREIPFCNVL